METNNYSFSDFNSNLTSLESVPPKFAKWKVESPELPFWKALSEPLFPNTALIIHGKTKEHAHKFIVNFVLDLKKESDIAFHFNPRFGHYVACNSRFNGHWDNEEAFGVGKVPFEKSVDFSLEFFLTSSEFLVAVDREHFCRFSHRSSPRQISKIEVFGDIRVYSIALVKKDHYPPSAVSDNIIVHDRLRVPYWRYFVEPVVPSTLIHIRGTIPEKAKSFIVDFYTDWSSEPDIGFHLRPRLKENYVACNNKRNGSWGQEEPNAWASCPFKKGHSFSLDILVTDTHFLVSVNGVKICKFEHRVIPNKIKYMCIFKDIVLKRVQLSREKIPLILGDIGHSVIFHSLDVPFHREFVDQIGPKTDLIISGVVNKDAIRFAVNLLDGRGDIGLHFNPRFDQNYVARNWRINGQWGTEEAQAVCRNPFSRGNCFALEIFLTRTDFLISVNGSHFCSFAYRIPISEIRTIEIDGDIMLTKVELNTKDQYPSLPIPEVKLSSFTSDLETPMVYKLKEALSEGSELAIMGRIKLLPWNFYINLQNSALFWPHPQVGYHLSIRMNDSNPGIILNTWSDNGWGKELVAPLKSAGTLLRAGAPFSVTIALSRFSFITCVDGHKLPDLHFSKGIDPCILRTLYIQGDVYISGIKIN